MLVNIILYLLQLIQYQHKQICWLLNFICRYIPLKQWAFDDSHSPKYQKFKIDELPLITDFRQDWTYKDLIPYYEKRYGKKILPIRRHSVCDIPDNCCCPRCDAPKPFLYNRFQARRFSMESRNQGSEWRYAYDGSFYHRPGRHYLRRI